MQGLVELLDKQGLMNRSRIGMGGFSVGSAAITWALMNSDLLAAAGVASSRYAPSNCWLDAMRGSTIPGSLQNVHEFGAPYKTPKRWRLISPALNVERIRAPLLMQLPEQEVRHQMEFFSHLSNTATPVELYAYYGAAHIKMQPRQRLGANRRNVDWLLFWLQDHVDAEPATAAQYRRWDALRQRWEEEAVGRSRRVVIIGRARSCWFETAQAGDRDHGNFTSPEGSEQGDSAPTLVKGSAGRRARQHSEAGEQRRRVV